MMLRGFGVFGGQCGGQFFSLGLMKTTGNFFYGLIFPVTWFLE